MPFVPNVNLDMPTISDNVPELVFVIPENTQNLINTRDIPKSMNTAPQNIKEIQDYLKSDDINDFIGEIYVGPIDGNVNDDLISTAHKIENKIFKLINKNVDNLILFTTANDLKSTIKILSVYQKNLKKSIKISKDQRIYELGKLKLLKK